MPYAPQQFDLPDIAGISQKTTENHLKLYEGYVKQVNAILEKLATLSNNPENHLTLLALQRRFSFEFDGMRNHEYYFAALEGGAVTLPDTASLKEAIAKEWGSFGAWLERFKVIATTRGVGWAMLYYDPTANRLLNAWVDEQHLGHLAGLSPLVALDMWEHAYLMDYASSDKGKYIDAYLNALNWETIENNFLATQK